MDMFIHSVSGLRSSIELMNKAARETAKGVEGDLIAAQVQAIEAKAAFSANIAMLKAADQIQKSLIDILA